MIQLPEWVFQPDEDSPGLYLECDSIEQREAIMRMLGWQPPRPPTPIADIHVGMRLKPLASGSHNQGIVTELTARGFKYRIPDDEEIISPHWSMQLTREGHEAFAIDGCVWWEPVLS